ncbi:hypothetical protein QQP08_002365 [Theobroma cacao]|nr:hypothetical protein QQP08_002365 [Theobroma cacao]
MAGIDYLEWGMDTEEWEQDGLDLPPAHLLAEEEGEEEIIGNSITYGSSANHFDLLSQVLVLGIIMLVLAISLSR